MATLLYLPPVQSCWWLLCLFCAQFCRYRSKMHHVKTTVSVVALHCLLAKASSTEKTTMHYKPSSWDSTVRCQTCLMPCNWRAACWSPCWLLAILLLPPQENLFRFRWQRIKSVVSICSLAFTSLNQASQWEPTASFLKSGSNLSTSSTRPLIPSSRSSKPACPNPSWNSCFVTVSVSSGAKLVAAALSLDILALTSESSKATFADRPTKKRKIEPSQHGSKIQDGGGFWGCHQGSSPYKLWQILLRRRWQASEIQLTAI